MPRAFQGGGSLFNILKRSCDFLLCAQKENEPCLNNEKVALNNSAFKSLVEHPLVMQYNTCIITYAVVKHGRHKYRHQHHG